MTRLAAGLAGFRWDWCRGVRLALGAACQVVLVVGVMLASVGQVRAEAVAKTHCKPKEQVVFSCVFKNNKTVSLCASEDLSQDKGVLQYRYGLLGKKLELEYPQLEVHPLNFFNLNSQKSSQSHDREISFKSGEYEYVLFSYGNSNTLEEELSLSIFKNENRLVTLFCRKANLINKTWLLDEIGLRKKNKRL